MTEDLDKSMFFKRDERRLLISSPNGTIWEIKVSDLGLITASVYNP